MNSPRNPPRRQLDPQQRQAVLHAMQKEFGTAMSQGMSVALWARVIPDALAIISPTREPEHNRTFAQLNARCNQLVRALRARGLSAGDSVALICSNRTEYAEVFWATRRAGLRITVLNWHLTGDEAAYIVNDIPGSARH